MIGLFEAFYNSIKPVQLLYLSVTIAESGELYLPPIPPPLPLHLFSPAFSSLLQFLSFSLLLVLMFSHALFPSLINTRPDGTTELPFEFLLEPLQGQQLYDTYHGVFVNIQYSLRCDMKRNLLAKDMQKSLEFIVEVPVCNNMCYVFSYV